MQYELDLDRLRRRLEERFGLRLLASSEVVDGGVFPAIRPADLEAGNGFSILVARTHRQVEASFRADNFSAGLLRQMSEADQESQKIFSTLQTEAIANAANVYVAVNGVESVGFPVVDDVWQMLEIGVTYRLNSGRVDSDAFADKALLSTSTCLALALALLPLQDAAEAAGGGVEGLPEGAKVRVEVNRYERSPVNRAACIAHYGTSCQACGFEFGRVYGDRGDGYVEVHHRYPVSQMGGEYFVNPVRDLVPVCANCHSMLHRSTPPMTVEELRELVGGRKDS